MKKVPGMCWLICGGRSAVVERALFAVAFEGLTNMYGLPDTITLGGYPVDDFAKEWANHHSIKVLNEFTGKPALVVAFPGASRVADIIKRARNAGIEVAEVRGS
jgi:hypothetical protein